MRKLVVEGSEYKVVHQELLCDLLQLSTSTYSQVTLTREMCNSNSIRTSAGSYFTDGMIINISGE